MTVALITIDPRDLPDDALMTALMACEACARQPYKQERMPRRANEWRADAGHLISGMSLAAEAWRRGLISASEQEAQ